MSDSKESNLDFKREQILNAIEAKRKKLAELKAKNISLSNSSSPASTPIKYLETSGSSWNSIVATIESLPTSNTATPIKMYDFYSKFKQKKQPLLVMKKHKLI